MCCQHMVVKKICADEIWKKAAEYAILFTDKDKDVCKVGWICLFLLNKPYTVKRRCKVC